MATRRVLAGEQPRLSCMTRTLQYWRWPSDIVLLSAASAWEVSFTAAEDGADLILLAGEPLLEAQ
eukprot:2489430-Amphidinium_carterae.1